MDMKEYVAKAEDIEWKVLEKKTIILEPKKLNFFMLNETGTFMWKELNGKITIKQLIDKLSRRYAAQKTQLNNDTLTFLKDLKQKKLVVFSTKTVHSRKYHELV